MEHGAGGARVGSGRAAGDGGALSGLLVSALCLCAAARVLAGRGDEVLVADNGDDLRLRETLAALNVPGVLGAGPEVLDGIDRVIASPGISPRNTVLGAAEARDVPIISEVGLGLELLGGDVRVAAVTGTEREDDRWWTWSTLCSRLPACPRRRRQLLANH